MLTLWVVPVVFVWVERLRQRIRRATRQGEALRVAPTPEGEERRRATGSGAV
jgi:hypothetical protein